MCYRPGNIERKNLCPNLKCKKINKPEATECEICGSELKPVKKCCSNPECNTLNDIEATECDDCGARFDPAEGN
jgi:hypothetical protein